jgi:hypothetical protein
VIRKTANNVIQEFWWNVESQYGSQHWIHESIWNRDDE